MEFNEMNVLIITSRKKSTVMAEIEHLFKEITIKHDEEELNLNNLDLNLIIIESLDRIAQNKIIQKIQFENKRMMKFLIVLEEIKDFEITQKFYNN